MATRKQIEANRRNSQLSTGPTSPEGKAVTRMNALKTGIDAQSQIITGEDPEALERLTAQYHDRFQPQGPEHVALIDAAISSDWLLRRLRKTEAELWNRSTAEHEANLFKWGQKPEAYPLAAAFRDQQKVFERLQRRISAAERSLRASLESLARLRKVGQALSPADTPASQVGPLILSPAKVGQALSPGNAPSQSDPPATLSNQDNLSEIGSVPANSSEASPDPPNGPVSAVPEPVPAMPDRL